jgi:pimeloyl-ACP methyl ester carboxylesterase
MSAAVLKRYISQRAKLIDGERGPGGADKVYAAVTETRAGDVILKRFISEVVRPYQASGRKEVKPQSNLVEPARRVRSHARAQDVYQEHFATADDGQPIFYNEVGKGAPAIMCFDGVGCDQYAWKYMVEGMKERHHVLRWNYAGHGRTPAPRDWPGTRSNRLSVEGLADDAIRVMDHAGVESAVLCGHSLGVQVALETWHRHPSRVTALVLMCGSYGRPLRTFHNRSDMERALPVIRTVLGLAPSVSRALWRRVVQSEVAYQFALTMEVNRQMVKRRDFGPYFTHLAGVDPILFAEMVGHANAHTAEAYLKDVNVPTLVVAGENDTFTPAYLSQHMQQAIPAAQLLTVPKGTHTAPIEIPELITLRVEKFLKERVVDRDPAALRRRSLAVGAPAGM